MGVRGEGLGLEGEYESKVEVEVWSETNMRWERRDGEDNGNNFRGETGMLDPNSCLCQYI